MVGLLPKVTLRAWTATDEPHLERWFQHAEVPQYLVPQHSGINLQPDTGPTWIPRDEASRLYAVVDARAAAGPPIGLGTLYAPTRDAVEVGLIIGEPAVWGRGYGRAATLALARAAFEDRACGRVVARIRPDNTRALACYRAVGFETREGRSREPAWLFLTRTAWAQGRAQWEAEAGA